MCPQAHRFQIADHLTFAVICRESVVLHGVADDSFSCETCLSREDLCPFVALALLTGIDHGHNLDSELVSKFEISCVVGRNGHDRAGAVADQDVIRDPDRNRFSIHRIDRVGPSKDSGFRFLFFLTLPVTFGGSCIAVFGDLFLLLFGRQSIDKGMFRRDDHISGAEQGIRTGGVDTQHVVTRLLRPARRLPRRFPVRNFIGSTDEEVDLGPSASSNPVPLQLLDALRPVHLFEVTFEAIGVCGDTEHPLSKGDSRDGMVAPFTATIGDLFVRKDCPQSRAPIDQSICLIGETMLILKSSN